MANPGPWRRLRLAGAAVDRQRPERGMMRQQAPSLGTLRRRALLVVVLMAIWLVATIAGGQATDLRAEDGPEHPHAARVEAKLRGAGLEPAVELRLDGPLANLLAQVRVIRAAGETPSIDALAGSSARLADAIRARALRIDAAGAVQVDAQIEGDGPSLTALQRLGVVVERFHPELGRAQYRLPPAALGDLALLPGVRSLRLPSYARSLAGSRQSEGDVALRANIARADFGLDGSGVRIGVISDGIAGFSQARASGDVPVLFDQRAFAAEGITAGAEGTAMIEIVHDLAPGAAISFANASTDLDMRAAVNFLAERNDIVVDDLGFFFPDDQQSAVSVNTAAALNNPAWPIRAYFTSVGNWAARHYQGAFVPGPDGKASLGLAFGGRVQRFAAGAGTTDAGGRGALSYNEIYLKTNESAFIVLFWDDPWGGSTNDYDLYLLNASNRNVAESTRGQGVFFDDPQEEISFTNRGPPGFFRIVVQNFDDLATPQTLELFVFDNDAIPGTQTALNFNTRASSMLAQSDAGGGVFAVAAIDQSDPQLDTIQPYSSMGPANNGALKPDITAVDGVAVTGSGGFFTPFFGTSAAAPHAAALAALLLEARPTLTAADGGSADAERSLLRAILLNSAVDLGVPGPDTTFGAGRIDAVAALEHSASTTLTVDVDTDAGAGSLRAAIETINAAAAEGATSGSIIFSSALTIRLATPLPPLDASNITLDGAASTIDGAALAVGDEGLVVRGDGAVIDNLHLTGFDGAGLQVSGAAGVSLTRLRLEANGTGLVIADGATATQVGTDDVVGVVAVRNRVAGVRISGADTTGAQIRRSFIGVEESGEAAGNGVAGVLITDGAHGNVIGAASAVAATLTVQQTEAAHIFQGTVTIGGLPAPEGTRVEALVDGVAVVSTTLRLLEVVGQVGFILTVPGLAAGPPPPAAARTITFTVDGVLVGAAFPFEAGALTVLVLDVAVVAESVAALPGGNVIAYNGRGEDAEPGGVGVRVTGAGSTGNTLRGNLIHSNGGANLDLAETDAPAAPSIASVSFSASRATVQGLALTGATVDLYAAVDPESASGVAAAPDGAGGAVRFLGSAIAGDGRFTIEDVVIGGATVLTALLTDIAGGTSPFAANLELGPGPRLELLSPASGSREGGTRVTLRGENFVGGSGLTVSFGGREAVILSTAPTELVVSTPAGVVGSVRVTVVNPNGRGATLAEGFAYTNTRTVLLRAGWNNVSWLGPITPLASAISALAGRADRVFAWDVEGQRYLSFIVTAPGFVNTLRDLTPGLVLWLFVGGGPPVSWEQPLP